ncbi:Spermatogenesis-associated protein 48 [Lamellibrachia satsuma]|nr:Spermatogenesis-associated protein 48 [Lamellibrachia satsuma]
MSAVVANGVVLSDSMYRNRPPFQTFLQSDRNAGGTPMFRADADRLVRQRKLPTLIGRKDVESFKDPQNPSDPAFKQWNDEGDHRADVPLRAVDGALDPISGFISVGGELFKKTGRVRMPSMVQITTAPHHTTPQSANSVRLRSAAAPPETRRATERDPGTPYPWNSTRVLDASIRAQLGGWTSDRDPRVVEAEKKGQKPKSDSDDLMDKLVHQYVYTTTMQRFNKDVPWDGTLRPKQWPPVSTLEKRPDMIAIPRTKKQNGNDHCCSDAQIYGRSWDALQTRRGYYKTGIPVPGIVFCSPCPRARQIPLYSGCIGGGNLEDIDNCGEGFTPYTVKRQPMPWPTDTAHRPNIPKYTGCTLYRSKTSLNLDPAHSHDSPLGMATTAETHKLTRAEHITPGFMHEGPMSKMVTTVPPYNPFNKLRKVEVVTVNAQS